MYLLALAYENARLNGCGEFSLSRAQGTIPKWTILDAGERNTELLRLIVASYSGALLSHRFPASFNAIRGTEKGPLVVAHLRVLHEGMDTRTGYGLEVTGGVGVTARGEVRLLSRSRRGLFFEDAVLRNSHPRPSPHRDFLLAYGAAPRAHQGDDDFDFLDPFHRVRRFHSLFSPDAPITDPVAFLGRLFYRGTRKKRFPPLHVLNRLTSLLKRHFDLDVDHWLRQPAEATREWDALPAQLHRPLSPILDAVRHILDAFPKVGAPLDLPGVILLDRPDRYCGDTILPAWLELVDALLPKMQFLTTLPQARAHLVPKRLPGHELSLPSPSPRRTPRKWHFGGDSPDVLLIDVDSRLPNLALMKLSRYFKEQGRKVALVRGVSLISGAREVFASCVFSSPSSARKVRALKAFYGDSLNLGGSGVDPRKRLPAEIEALPADYDLYPELGDRAIGFLTRGCPMHCPFCIVPLKEGPPHRVSDLDTLLEGGRLEKLILLDDNLLAHSHAEEVLEEMASREILVNFTQTLDLRFVDRARAALLRRIGCTNTRFTRPNIYFSLNDTVNLPFVREKYGLFGFGNRDNVEFICMYGYNTTLAEDVARFRFLRTLPGAYVFTQEYQPVPGGPVPDLTHFFEEDPDRLIRELIAVEFTQNMKSMEKYYRWVSRRYAESFGTLHKPLVDTIFRYNRRHTKGHYMQTLAGLNKQGGR